MGEQEREKDRSRNAEKATPRTAREQSEPEQERPQRPAEEAGVAPHQVEDPPQAEGDRDD